MAVTRLIERQVEKVWGRRDLPPPFGTVAGPVEPIGEILFEHRTGDDLPLLVKYLFTADKLSVQVHPDGLAARAAGYRRGKDEAWLVLESWPDAAIGLGLSEPIGKEELRAAALDGSIEQLIDWRPVSAGDFYYSPAGTIHAIGRGVALIEIQQNVDLTYRLYDYGRPRELHLDEGIKAADPGPYAPPMRPYAIDEYREILAEGRAFVLERWRGETSLIIEDSPTWLIMVRGVCMADGEMLEPGSVWLAEQRADLRLGQGAELLVAYPGSKRR